MIGHESFVADTHAIIWHLLDHPQLSSEARLSFKKADHGEAILYISAISIIEILYLYEKKKIDPSLWTLFQERIPSEPEDSYQIISLDYTLAIETQNVPKKMIPELPDRIIAATAFHLGVPLITKDQRLQNWKGITTVW